MFFGPEELDKGEMSFTVNPFLSGIDYEFICIMYYPGTLVSFGLISLIRWLDSVLKLGQSSTIGCSFNKSNANILCLHIWCHELGQSYSTSSCGAIEWEAHGFSIWILTISDTTEAESWITVASTGLQGCIINLWNGQIFTYVKCFSITEMYPSTACWSHL